MSHSVHNNTTDLIRVMIVDDHAYVRSGLRYFLLTFDDLTLVGEAADGCQAVRLCSQVAPDVVLMDVVMPKMDGIRATRAIRRNWPKTQVIALTALLESEIMEKALKAGAISYLLKHISADELVEAIRAAYAGRTVSPPPGTDMF